MRPREFYSRAARKGVNCTSDQPQPTTSFVTPLSTYIHKPSESFKAVQLLITPLKPGLLFDGLEINMEEPRSDSDVSEHGKPAPEPSEEEGSSYETPQDM